ncbi:uncharacterized protein ACWYII_028103 [Salvelinus alpinus]
MKCYEVYADPRLTELQPPSNTLSEPQPQLQSQLHPLSEPQPLPQPDTLPQPWPQPQTLPQPDTLSGPQPLPQPDSLPEPQHLPQPDTLPEPQPLPQPDSLPEPQPLPQPDTLPEPQPLPQPDSLPEPQPLPQPDTLPEPQPLPQPDSLPEPQPLPQPDTLPEPQPLPQPDSLPEPQPLPQPDTLPEPQPLPQPDSLPEPQPLPQPDTLPKPQPLPQPDSLPEPQPLPQPDTLPEPQPLPQPDSLPEPQPLPQPDSLPEPQPQPLPQPDTLPEPQPQSEEEVKTWVWTCHRILHLFLLASPSCASILGLAYYSQQHLPPESTPPASPPCTSPACHRATAHLPVSVDPFTQPCDYFLFPCGSEGVSLSTRGRQRGKGVPLHPQGHELGSTGRERGRKERETGKDIREKVPADRMPDRLLTMREILETEDHSSPGNSAKQKACMFYLSCMDTGPTETAGPEPFLRLVHKLGGWAVSGQWNQTDFNSTLSLLMRDYGTFPFFSVYVGKDPNDTQGDKRYIQVIFRWQEYTTSVTGFIKKCIEDVVPTVTVRTYLKQKPWITGNIHTELKGRAAAFKEKDSNPEAYQKSRYSRRRTIKQAKRQYWTKIESYYTGSDACRMWQGMQTITDYKGKHSRELPSDTSIPDELNNFYACFEASNIETCMRVSAVPDDCDYALRSRCKTFKQVNIHKAAGPDGLPGRVLRACTDQLASVFTDIFNLSLSESVIPTCFTQTTVVLVPKNTKAEELIQNVYSSIKSKLPDLRWRDEESRMSVLNKIQSLTPRLSTKNNIFSEAELSQLYSKEEYFIVVELVYIANKI